MSKYERAYGTDWERLDEDEAINRAYALGVAASMGEYHPDELDRIRGETDTAYSQSVVDLAFEEGKTEALASEPDVDEESEAVWSALVEGDAISLEDDRTPTGGRDGIPRALDRTDLLDRVDIDSTDRVDRPDFLERD